MSRARLKSIKRQRCARRARNISPQLRCQALALAGRACAPALANAEEGEVNVRERQIVLDAVGLIDDAVDIIWQREPPWNTPEPEKLANIARLLADVRGMLKRVTATG